MSERPIHKLVLNRAQDQAQERVQDQAAVESPAASAGTIRFEDAVLVRRVQDGDPAAFTTLVSKYQDKVHNACWRMCGNAEDARELTQEAFLRAYQGLAAFKGQSGFYTWLFRIAMNLALSQRRKATYRTALSLDGPVGQGTQAESLVARMADRSTPSPSGRTMQAELQSRIEGAMAALDPEHRTVVVLRDIEGMDYAQIAEVLEVAAGTVKSRLHRARAALREALAPYVEMG